MTYRAIRHARDMARRDVPIPEGLCVLLVRQAMGINEPTGDQDGDGDADAHDGWRRARDKRFLSGDDFRLTRGAAVWFAATPMATRHGHVAIPTGFGKGHQSTVWSPGVPGAPTRWRKVTLAQLERGWDLDLVGESLDVNGHRCPDIERG